MDKPKVSFASRCNACLGVVANVAQIWPFVCSGSVSVAIMFYAHLESMLGSVVATLGITVCCMILMACRHLGRQQNKVLAPPPEALIAEAKRLEAAKRRIADLAECAATIRSGRRISIGVDGGDSVPIGPPHWTIETKNSLRAIVRPDIYKNYEAILKSKEPRDGAKVFLESLADTLSVSHLLS